MRLLALLILGVWLPAVAVPQPPTPRDDEAKVYRTALAAVGFKPGTSSKRVALMATTFDPGVIWRGLEEQTPSLHPRRRLKYAKPETVEAFLAAIDTQQPLPAALGRLPEFFLVQPGDAPKPDGWRAFERRHGLSPGVVSVSRIGFDGSRSQALVYISVYCGPLCGEDTFVLLERHDAGWRVVKTDLYSMS